jgi:cyclopropane fatty-acyl-phospholipid synthase-like methyltransferase
MSEIVRQGYRQLGAAFDEWRDRIVGDPRGEWRDLLASKLEPGSRVLELGCGNGDDARALALRGLVVTGVDLVARAPNIPVIEDDFLELELPEASYDACVSFYVFNHVPRERLAALLAKINRWLVPGGWFMHAFGQSDLEAWTGTWIDDAPTFFSSYPAEVNSQLVADAGFEIERDELVTFREPEGEATFQWILARRGL